MTHSRCIKHREHSLGETAMLREHPAGSDIDNRLAPAFVSVMQNKYLFSVSMKISTTTAIHTHVLYTY